jgi:hypothetical protein
MSDLNEQERQLIAELKALAAETTQGAHPRVRERLSAEFRRRKSRWRMPMAIAAAVAVTVLATIQIRTRPAPVVQPEAAFLKLDEREIGTGLVMRMKLPATVFGGAPDAPDVLADVLVGDDGLAHGIRLVN